MTSNVEAVRRAQAAFNAGDLAGYLELYDDDLVLHGYAAEPMGRTEVAAFYQSLIDAFDGARLDVHDVFDGPDDRAVIRFTMAGRHTGSFMGVPATGRDVALPGITILRFRDGRCVERWASADMLGLLTQLGAVEPPQQVAPAAGAPATT